MYKVAYTGFVKLVGWKEENETSDVTWVYASARGRTRNMEHGDPGFLFLHSSTSLSVVNQTRSGSYTDTSSGEHSSVPDVVRCVTCFVSLQLSCKL